MKKQLLLALSALVVSLCAVAAPPKLPIQDGQKIGKQSITPPPTKLSPNALGSAIADYESINDWVSIGQLRYSDIFCALADGDGGAYGTYKVDAEESESHPGLYRIKNPAASNPYTSYGVADTSQDYWLIIDATDPESVFIPKQKYGYTADNGEVYVSSWSAGTVDSENHWITFPAWGMVYYYGDSGAYSANNPNEFLWKLYLPGSKDYTFNLYQENFCANDGKFYVTTEVGDDIALTKYVFGRYSSLNAAVGAIETECKTLEGNSLTLTNEDGDGKYFFVAYGYDENGEEQGSEALAFFSNDIVNNQEWKSAGEGVITENFVGRVFGGSYGPNTYTAEIEESVSTPGFYRIPNPYFACSNQTLSFYAQAYMDHYDHYIYIHTENGEVTLDEGPIGLDLGYGEMCVMQTANTATFENGTITFPAGSIGIWMVDYSLTGYWASNMEFKVVLPVEHTVTAKSEDEKYGTVTFTSPEAEGPSVTTTAGSVTFRANPAEGVSFLNWTDEDGNEVSTDATYTYVGSANATFIAHFGLALTYTFPTNGTLVVTQGGNTVTSGTVFPVATVIDVKATPAENYVIDALTLNGVKVDADAEGNYSFALSEATEIAVVFTEERFETILTMLATGNGHIEAWTEVDDEYNPVSGQIVSGSPISMADGEELTFIFIPGDGEEVLSASYTIGGETTPLELDGDFWVPEDNAEYVAKNICVFPFDQFQQDLTLSVVFSGENQGIEEIGVDEGEGPVEYYNLQGVRVAADNLTPGFYIVRQGAKATKVFVTK